MKTTAYAFRYADYVGLKLVKEKGQSLSWKGTVEQWKRYYELLKKYEATRQRV